MAVRYWTNGGADNSWATAGNWSGGAVPVNGDDVVFSGQSSNANVTGGLNQSAVALHSLTIDETYAGQIGVDAATYLQIDITNGTNPALRIGGASAFAFYWKGSATNISGDSASTNRLYLKGGTFTGLGLRRGTYTILTGTTITTAVVLYGTNISSDVSLSVDSGSTLTTWHNLGGAVTLNSIPTTLHVVGGAVTQSTAGTITTLTQNGGTFTWKDGSTITTLNGNAGTFDATDVYNSATITNCYVNGPTFVLNLDLGGKVAFTNGIISRLTLPLITGTIAQGVQVVAV